MNLNRTDLLIKRKHILSHPLPTSPMVIGNGMSQAGDSGLLLGVGWCPKTSRYPDATKLLVETHFLNTEWSGKTTVRDGHTGTGHGFHLSGLTYFYRSGLQLPSSNSVLSANVLTTTPRHLLPFPRPSSARQTGLRASARIRLRTRGQKTGQEFFLLPGG